MNIARLQLLASNGADFTSSLMGPHGKMQLMTSLGMVEILLVYFVYFHEPVTQFASKTNE